MEFKTMKYHFKCTKKERNLLRLLCHISKNIYNSALYELRQEFFKNKSICTYFDLNKIMKENENFHIFNTYASICSIRQAHNNMKKFIDKSKKMCCKLPKYLDKHQTNETITVINESYTSKASSIDAD